MNNKTLGFTIGGAVAFVILLVIIFSSFVTIGAGEGGVLFRPFSGGVDTKNIYTEGFHVVAPWNTMYEYEVRQRELKENMQVLSSNGLDIDLEVSLWYHPDINKLAFLHQLIGEDYVDRVIQPAIRSAARSVIGRYTPEQIYSSKRDAIQKEIFDETTNILENKFIVLERVLVRDVSLPPTIKDAIERKLKQEQESLEYEFRLQKASKEAQRQEIEALGKATANGILNASLSENILRDKGIDATNRLAESNNSKIIIIGDKDGMPLILGNQ